MAVPTAAGFDASLVEPAVKLAGAAPEHWKSDDVDGDGDLDLLFYFDTEDSNQSSEGATLTGQTGDGNEITGTDPVRIAPPKGKK